MDTTVLHETATLAVAGTTAAALENSTARPAEIQLRDISLAFEGQQVLHRLDASVRPGELILLGGGNGTGKTALLNVLCGYLRSDQGTAKLRLNGSWFDAGRTSPDGLARRGVGRLWQDIRLFPTLSVLENVLAATPGLVGQQPVLALAMRNRVAAQEREARERAFENLRRVGLLDRARSSCDMLSLGQMKRVALARLLQMDASLMLLDEPFAGLDAPSRHAFVADIERLRAERPTTMLVVEHERDLLTGVADRVWMLEGGRIVEQEETEWPN